MQSGWRCLGLAVTLALVVGRAVADTDEGDTMASTIIVPFGFNSAAFAPDEVQRLALADAPGAALVAVRARTSNDRATPSDEALALARALAARRYLVAHGVSPLNPPFTWHVGEYNDGGDAARLVEEHAHELAAVIVEPLQGAAGVIPGEPSFLRALRQATAEHGVLLVFDEVMTARLSRGGMQQLLGIDPDLTTLAKFVGGGLSFGAFGGCAI